MAEKPDYGEAYRQLFEGRRARDPKERGQLSPAAKDLLGGDETQKYLWFDLGVEDRSAFIKKHGPEKSIQSIEDFAKHLGYPAPPATGEWMPNASGYPGWLRDLRAKILSDQTN